MYQNTFEVTTVHTSFAKRGYIFVMSDILYVNEATHISFIIKMLSKAQFIWNAKLSDSKNVLVTTYLLCCYTLCFGHKNWCQ